jgi:hypothetical protein
MVDPKGLGQLGQVKTGSKVKTLFGWKIFLLEVFWLKGVFGKHPPKTILTVLILEKIGFYQTGP